tara:strand:- start:845 stop:1207 length:363 start_codon:yes stop_codon:yes gene_type:complete
MSVSSITLDVAKRLDITCRKGDTFNLAINVTDSAGTAINLTTYSFKMQIRETDTSSGSTVSENNVTITGTSGGVLTANIDSSIMSSVSSGLYAYDLQTIKAGTTQTWLTGVIQVNEDVTV